MGRVRYVICITWLLTCSIACLLAWSLHRKRQCPLPEGAGKVVAITCGENHNLVLTSLKGSGEQSSRVYTWGFGESGALGQGGKDEDEMRPKAIDLAKAKLPNVTMVQMAAGGQHTALLGMVTK